MRYSTHGAHWFIGRAIEALVERSGIAKDEIDGLTVSSFSLAPDTAVGVTQHLGLSPRWLDHIPTGGASGVMALRRAARAVQAGDADVVACVAADANHVESFRQMLGGFSHFARDASYPYGSGGPNSIFAFITAAYMRSLRRDARGLRPHRRRPARQRAQEPERAVQDAAHARAVPRGAADRRADPPVRLRHAVRRRRGVPGDERGARARPRPRPRAACAARSSATTPSPTTRCCCAAAGASTATTSTRRPACGPTRSTSSRPTTTIRSSSCCSSRTSGSARRARAPAFVRARTLTHDGDFPNNTSGGQLSAGQAGCAGGFLGMTEAIRQLTGDAGERAVKDAQLGLVSGFGMVTYDRCLCTGAVILAGRRERGHVMTMPLMKPRKKNPVLRTRQMNLPPWARGRTALGMTAAAAEGRFELQVCQRCQRGPVPAARCLPPLPVGAAQVDAAGRRRRADQRDRAPSQQRSVLPRAAAVAARPGPPRRRADGDRPPARRRRVAAACRGAAPRSPVRVHVGARLDRAGAAVLIGFPPEESEHMADDKMLREMTSDPKFRKILVTDGKTEVGQALVKALVKAGADIVWVGHAEPWKKLPGLDDITALTPVTLVPLDLTNGRSVSELAGEIGGKVDIVVNNAEVHRAFGIAARRGTDAAQAEMDINYFGLLRLAQEFGPALKGALGRRRDACRRVGQPALGLRALELPAARHLLGLEGGGVLARAVPARRDAARAASASSTSSRGRSTTSGTRTCRRPRSRRRRWRARSSRR